MSSQRYQPGASELCKFGTLFLNRPKKVYIDRRKRLILLGRMLILVYNVFTVVGIPGDGRLVTERRLGNMEEL